MSVILEGKEVPFSKIDFEKHIFKGMYRPPENEIGYEDCPCRMKLRNRRDVHDHYKAGHFDIPSYVMKQKDMIITSINYGDEKEEEIDKWPSI